MFELKLVLFFILVDFLSDIVGTPETPDIKPKAPVDVTSPFAGEDRTESLICYYKYEGNPEFKLFCKKNFVYITYGKYNLDTFDVTSCEVEKTLKTFTAPKVENEKITMYILKGNECEVKEYVMDQTQTQSDMTNKRSDTKDFKTRSTKRCEAKTVYEGEKIDSAYTYLQYFKTCLPMSKELGNNVKEFIDDYQLYGYTSGWPRSFRGESESPGKLACFYEDGMTKLELLCQPKKDEKGSSEEKYEVFINQSPSGIQWIRPKVQRMLVNSCDENKIISSIFPSKTELTVLSFIYSLDTGKCIKRMYYYKYVGIYGSASEKEIECPSDIGDWAPDMNFGQVGVWQSCTGSPSAQNQKGIKPVELFLLKAKPID